MKGVHSFYQLRVVLNDDDVRIALIKPWKWATHSTPAMQLSCKNLFGFRVFTHKDSSIGSQHSSQDQEVRNGFKISLNPMNIPFKIKKRGWKKKRKKGKDKKRLERGEIYQ